MVHAPDVKGSEVIVVDRTKARDAEYPMTVREAAPQFLGVSVQTVYLWVERGVADEWVTQLLRQSDAQVFKAFCDRSVEEASFATVSGEGNWGAVGD